MIWLFPIYLGHGCIYNSQMNIQTNNLESMQRPKNVWNDEMEKKKCLYEFITKTWKVISDYPWTFTKQKIADILTTTNFHPWIPVKDTLGSTVSATFWRKKLKWQRWKKAVQRLQRFEAKSKMKELLVKMYKHLETKWNFFEKYEKWTTTDKQMKSF